MKDNVIFIHIPKTGGTTINTAMAGTAWSNNSDFNYRHFNSKKSTAGDIFLAENFEKYQKFKIFTMLRHPLDRIISEYYFAQHRTWFMESLRQKPKDFEQFVNAEQTHNGMVTFLKGREIYSKTYATESDLNDIITSINDLPIHVGIFEQFSKSMAYFSEVTGIQWEKEIEAKRMTFKRPKSDDLSDELRELILDKNQLDLKLYNHCLEKFNNLEGIHQSNEINFNLSKYTDILHFCQKWCLFDFYMKNKKYRKQQHTFFKKLNFYILNDLKISDGKMITQIWNKSFLNAVEHHFPSSIFSKAMIKAYNSYNEPLEQLDSISQEIDKFFEENQMRGRKYFYPMKFNKSFVEDIA